MFPQLIHPEFKQDVRIANQFLEKIDGLIMKGLRRDLAAAEARVLAGAAGGAEFLFLSISRRLRDRDAIRRGFRAEVEAERTEHVAKTKNMRRYRKESWLMRQSAANRSLKRDSLLSGKRTGNFTKIGPFGKRRPVRT
jgi:hypothetical protein